MHLFYTPNITGKHHLLDESESKHAVRVLRLSKGDPVILIDGIGGWYHAAILDDHPKRCILEIRSHEANYQPSPYHLHMAVAPTKNIERFEWFLEKATEIGISEITPLLCTRSERRQIKPERLERILISAMKQSLRAWKPVLNEAVSLETFLKTKRNGIRGIAHCYPKGREAISSLAKGEELTLLVGPEGDFSEEEVEMAIAAGYQPFHLGDARLRTETAALYTVMAVSLLNA